jgi:hypothetical protein
MPMETIVHPNGTHPQAFLTGLPRYRWESFQSADAEEMEMYGGFAVKVRVNPSHDELRAEAAALGEGGQDAFFARAAPRIIAWNAMAAGEDGEPVPIPAPGEYPDNPDQWRAVYTLEPTLVAFCQITLQTAHWGGEARKKFWSKYGAPPEPGSVPSSADAPGAA